MSDLGFAITIVLGTSLKEAEKRLVMRTLEHHELNRTATAKSLGISIRTLQRRLKSYGYVDQYTHASKSKQPLTTN